MLIVGLNPLVGQWVAQQIGMSFHEGMVAIGSSTAKGKGGVIFENWNKRNIFAHIAGEGEGWITKEFLWYIFFYPFEELGCDRITVVVASSNKFAQNLATRLGFELETQLIEAHPDGDLLIYRLLKTQCRWHLLEPYYGKRKQTCNSELQGSR